jgi:Ca2+-binding RTX toxin-like protein
MAVWKYNVVGGVSLGTEELFTSGFDLPEISIKPKVIRLFGDNNMVVLLTGLGIAGSAEGLTAGKITGAQIKVSGNIALEVTGLNVRAVDLTAATSSGAEAVARLLFSGADKVTGTSLGEDLYGFGGSDTIHGGGGRDRIDAGSGQNVVNGGGGHDTINGGLGIDKITGSAGDDFILSDGDTAEDKGSADILYGGAGNDTIVAHGGNDFADGGAGIDVLVGLFGNDRFYGGADNDTVDGGVGKDNLFGGAGNDLVAGQQGIDRLNGGLGKDTLIGGDGADKFVFDTALGGANADQITDFVVGQDQILLDNDIFKALTVTGDLAAGRFVVGTEAGDANDRILYDAGTGRVYYDRDGDGSAAKQLIVTLNGAPGLTADDFLIIN